MEGPDEIIAEALIDRNELSVRYINKRHPPAVIEANAHDVVGEATGLRDEPDAALRFSVRLISEIGRSPAGHPPDGAD